MEQIIDVFTDIFNVPKTELLGRGKKYPLNDYRKILAHVLRSKGYSHISIALVLNRDRTTVVYLIDKCEDHIVLDKYFKEQYNKFTKAISDI